ncbi:hypothetical protein BGW80DRAFT_1226035 [Lactifluus volemus]|nr:hypothetical protein BGW80DRAFT_1226035 [Lactifluus volemus]
MSESSEFLFNDSQVVLQVENQTYKIHRYFLVRESDVFCDLFIPPQPKDTTGVEGSDYEHPIILSQTTIVELENLLRFFYFGMHDDYKASLTDWVAMLSIATRFVFEKVRQRAIKEITLLLDKIDPFELIRLAIKYDVEAWLKPAYCQIVMRNSRITHAEALKVPFPMAVMLMRSREQYWKNSKHGVRSAFGSTTSSWASPPGPELIVDSEVKFMELASKEPLKNYPATTVTQRSRNHRKINNGVNGWW